MMWTQVRELGEEWGDRSFFCFPNNKLAFSEKLFDVRLAAYKVDVFQAMRLVRKASMEKEGIKVDWPTVGSCPSSITMWGCVPVQGCSLQDPRLAQNWHGLGLWKGHEIKVGAGNSLVNLAVPPRLPNLFYCWNPPGLYICCFFHLECPFFPLFLIHCLFVFTQHLVTSLKASPTTSLQWQIPCSGGIGSLHRFRWLLQHLP